MSEFFLELFSEEIPPNFNLHAREEIIFLILIIIFKEKINFKIKGSSSLSTPNRISGIFENISKEIVQKSEEIRGPNS